MADLRMLVTGLLVVAACLAAPPATAAPPAKPVGLVVSQGTYPDKVHATWQPHPLAAQKLRYILYRRNPQAGNRYQVKSFSANNLTSLDAPEGASVAGGYFCLTVTPPEGVESPCSDEVWGFAGTLPAPAPVTQLVATQGTDADRVRVSWYGVHYKVQVQRLLASGGVPQDFGVAAADFAYLDDKAATPGVHYWYRARACGFDGACGPWTVGYVEGWRSGSYTPPGMVNGVTATEGTFADKVRVTWRQFPGASYGDFVFHIERSDAKDQIVNRKVFTEQHLVYDDTSARPGQTYYYRVSACHAQYGCPQTIVGPWVPGHVKATGPNPSKVKAK